MGLWTVILLGGLTFPGMVEIECHQWVAYSPAVVERQIREADRATGTDMLITSGRVVFRRPRHGEFCRDGSVLRAGYHGHVYTSSAFTVTRPATKADDWPTGEEE